MTENGENSGIPRESSGGTDQGGEVPVPANQWPSRRERQALIQAYQAEALAHADPHVANLELINGDLMLLALRVRQSLEKHLIEGTAPEEGRRFETQAEMWLRCARQIERTSRVIWQLSRPGKGEAGPT